MTRDARAEVRLTNELIREFKRVTGKENLLFRVAEATVDAGDMLVATPSTRSRRRRCYATWWPEFKACWPTRTGTACSPPTTSAA